MLSISRRGALLGAACLAGCAHSALGQKPRNMLDCTDVMAPPPLALTPAEEETHDIFLLLAMSLVFDGWGVDRRRPEQVAAFAAIEPGRVFADYTGHNIGALLVNKGGSVVCFALNRSVEFNSTLEHAEARTVRAAIQIANDAAAQTSADVAPWSFSRLLQADRLYTTLEPCAQCAGILEIANISSVVFAQDDPVQHHIINVLYNLNTQPHELGVALPIRASFLPLWDELASAYQRFLDAAPPGGRTGLTSFLETVDAYRVYRAAATRFDTMQAQDPGNACMLRDARGFRAQWQGSVAHGLVPMYTNYR